MDRVAFGALLDATHARVVALNETKGEDYSGADDVLRNFREAALDVDTTPERTWLVYFHKHFAAIRAYIVNGRVHSEPIEGRIIDAILYLYLLLAMVEERLGTTRPLEGA